MMRGQVLVKLQRSKSPSRRPVTASSVTAADNQYITMAIAPVAYQIS
jgi:hypothetical protein